MNVHSTIEPQIAIVEFGSQHTLQIVRMARDLGHHSILVKPEELEHKIYGQHIRCIIGSGGLRSVYEDGAPTLSPLVLLEGNDNPFPYLGICYGMQTSVHQQGGVVQKGRPEYGRAFVELTKSPLFEDLSSLQQEVWMSHGDGITKVPEGFDILGRSDGGHIVAVGNRQFAHYGVQFHPEVSNTPEGKTILRNFIERIAGCTPNYTQESMRHIVAERLRQGVGADRALLLYSGGVDSTTIAAVGSQALPKGQLVCVTFDGGHLREGEIDEIRHNAGLAGIELTVITTDEFVNAVGATLDPERKRAAFREVYARLTRQSALEFGATKIIQGTIAPDRIESGMTGGARIKTHHNSSGLDFGDLSEVHPIEDLFKDEVRALARSLGLPMQIFNRPPFPGPGNFLRVVNIHVDRENLAVVQWVEARVRELCAQDQRYCDISQTVVAVIGRAVGVKGDQRVFGYMVGIRGVITKDFMTAEGVAFEPNFQKKMSQKLCEHPLVVQVGFFPTDKPPGTTEFE